jgi:hypothetical protein
MIRKTFQSYELKVFRISMEVQDHQAVRLPPQLPQLRARASRELRPRAMLVVPPHWGSGHFLASDHTAGGDSSFGGAWLTATLKFTSCPNP